MSKRVKKSWLENREEIIERMKKAQKRKEVKEKNRSN